MIYSYMNIWISLVFLILAYLMGSVSSAVWLGRAMKGVDVRNLGSGNAGFANVMRNLGPLVGVPVLIIDTLKGYLAVQLAYLIPGIASDSEALYFWQIIFGMAALVGHLFPIFTGFRGGKGVATGLGIVLAIYPFGALLSFVVFLIAFLASQYVSLGSLMAGISFPLFVLFLLPGDNVPLMVFSWVVAALLVLTHQKNIDRILKGQEHRAGIFKRK
ncbi:MAG: glycerol-3-phosphate 1-O-acyltransferase [Porphyromonadaceae bacterium]|nr:MAG: glycerol-3-phosphate 1-O-acyltransferase [Porphyromonadaceae bacterium]